MPLSIKDTIKVELDQLKAAGIIKRVTYSEWAVIIVAVPKRDGMFRVCAEH